MKQELRLKFQHGKITVQKKVKIWKTYPFTKKDSWANLDKYGNPCGADKTPIHFENKTDAKAFIERITPKYKKIQL